jgi:trehalose synthase-fused probable maltokinase
VSHETAWVERLQAGDLDFVDEDDLLAFVVCQRWFGGRQEDITSARVLEAAPIRTEPPVLVTALVELRSPAGTHDLYQLLLGLGPRGEEDCDDGVVTRLDGFVVRDALADPRWVPTIVGLIRASADVAAGEGAVVFRNAAGAHAFGSERPTVQRFGGEQSNSSFIVDDRLILKAYRRVEAGPNPELELLRFLTDHDFPNVPSLVGWYGYEGPLIEATLGVLQRYVPDSEDGWDVLAGLLEREGEETFLPRVRRLGEVTAGMHLTLASEPGDPAFAPEEPSAESLAILAARIEDEALELFASLPDLDVLEPITAQAETVRDRLRTLPAAGSGGRLIRHHGDYHLGQVLWTGEDWMVIDFEGEPTRHLTERRRKRSPLRDVAGMLRSFGYAAAAFELQGGRTVSPDWLGRAREEFLAAYLPPVDAAGLLPHGRGAVDELLAVFELEKALYELRYELGHRPEWVAIAVAGIADVLAR